nr:hypothetical protein [Mesorhizobium sediminum]
MGRRVVARGEDVAADREPAHEQIGDDGEAEPDEAGHGNDADAATAEPLDHVGH